MRSKRQVLAELCRDELVAVIDRQDLAPRDRRPRDGGDRRGRHPEKVTLVEISPALGRAPLKDLFRTFGLDDGRA